MLIAGAADTTSSYSFRAYHEYLTERSDFGVVWSNNRVDIMSACHHSFCLALLAYSSAVRQRIKSVYTVS